MREEWADESNLRTCVERDPSGRFEVILRRGRYDAIRMSGWEAIRAARLLLDTVVECDLARQRLMMGIRKTKKLSRKRK